MTNRAWRLGAVALSLLALGTVAIQLPALGASGLLHPARRSVVGPPPPGCLNVTFSGEKVRLRGWHCRTSNVRRGMLIYLHGIADNRMSVVGIVGRFNRRGFDVVAYDGRAHGESDGEVCTYGFFEKQDLARVLDTIMPGPIVLVGTSLGAAVALQGAAEDTRVKAVVAAEVFSDLPTVVRERAPFFFTSGLISRAIQLAEEQGRFRVEAVSPVLAARKIKIPVLLIHGAADTQTPPDHSRRVFDALSGEKRLLVVPGARHNESLAGNMWNEVERWIDDVISA